MTGAREILWQREVQGQSLEQLRVVPGGGGTELVGTVLAAESGAPLRVDYRIRCDAAWRTVSVTVEQSHGGRRRLLRLDHDGAGVWRRDGSAAPDLGGCTDVDLGVSPSTNTVAINRLRLATGEAATIRAAWVRFPALDVTPAEQEYERLGERRYRYRSRASGFTAVIETDEDGFAVEYEGSWRRVASGTPAPGGFADALQSDRPAAELGAAAEDFGWLVGGWAGEVRDFDPDGSVREGSGEWWFAWTLEGRAIQDVWIVPPRGLRDAPRAAADANDRYGTTVRRFDRAAGLWRIAWINPVTGAANQLAGRRDGDRIVLLGEAEGRPIRWSFNEITRDSFRWLGEVKEGDAWRAQAEFRLRRIA